jgi:hypothetical protein
MGGHLASLDLPESRDSRRSGSRMVGPGRLELPTPALSGGIPQPESAVFLRNTGISRVNYTESVHWVSTSRGKTY